MRVPQQRLLVVFVVVAGLLAACDGGDPARPGTLNAASSRRQPGASANNSDGSGAESGAGADSGGTCSSCSIDTDCQNACPVPSHQGDVWCCALGTCFTWGNACPPLSIGSDSGDGASVDSASDAPPDDGGLLNAPPDCQPSGTHGGHRWQDLYACYFGPLGNVSCGSVAGCHQQPSDPGAVSSHFVCNPTPDACWQSLTTWLVAPADAASDPTMTLLYSVLCKSNGYGVMPRGCPERLLTGDLARIAAWIQEGAPNN